MVPGTGDDPDLVYVGRENGRVLLLDAATGEVRAKTLLPGSVRRIIVTDSGSIVIGTSHALFTLDPRLNVTGSRKVTVEDIALAQTARGTTVFVLSSTGRLAALQIDVTSR